MRTWARNLIKAQQQTYGKEIHVLWPAEALRLCDGNQILYTPFLLRAKADSLPTRDPRRKLRQRWQETRCKSVRLNTFRSLETHTRTKPNKEKNSSHVLINSCLADERSSSAWLYSLIAIQVSRSTLPSFFMITVSTLKDSKLGTLLACGSKGGGRRKPVERRLAQMTTSEVYRIVLLSWQITLKFIWSIGFITQTIAT